MLKPARAQHTWIPLLATSLAGFLVLACCPFQPIALGQYPSAGIAPSGVGRDFRPLRWIARPPAAPSTASRMMRLPSPPGLAQRIDPVSPDVANQYGMALGYPSAPPGVSQRPRWSGPPQPNRNAPFVLREGGGQNELGVFGNAGAGRSPRIEPAADPQQLRAMQAVARKADELTRVGFALANRGATFSAREKFIRALEAVAQAADADQQTDAHGQFLVHGLRALEECRDFIPHGNALDGEIEVEMLVAGHRTEVLKGWADGVSAVAAVNRYYTYAQQELAQSVDKSPAGSMALYGLGKLYIQIGEQAGVRILDPQSQSQVFHQAALMVDSNNWMAANELGVLLAQRGQYEKARQWLRHSVALSSKPVCWRNLARVHKHLGEELLSRQAQQKAEASDRARGDEAAGLSRRAQVALISPKQFSVSPTQGPASRQASPATRAMAPPKAGTMFSWLPWR